MSTVEPSASPEQLGSYFAYHGTTAFHDQPLMAFERVSSAVLSPPRTQQERDQDPPGFRRYLMSSMTFRNVLLAALVLACSGCARFENPIVAGEGPRFDDRLAGHWYTESDEGKFDMQIRRDGDEGIIVATGTKLGEEPESDQMRLITARIGQQTFASVAGFKEGSNWTLFRYDIATPDVLVLYQDNEHAWDDAVKNKLLPGKADESGRERGSTVTASSEQLRDFVLGYGSVIFNDQPSAEFRRAPAD